jgi:hypothetical protein
LQEGGAPFQTTHWTVVLEAGKAESDGAARKALAIFSETYWPPLYTFVRRRGYSPGDAQDINVWSDDLTIITRRSRYRVAVIYVKLGEG